MAKLTGQFTTPSLDTQNNKTHKPFLHGVVFVFTGATKVTRETDAKGKYSFDLANGEYEVSVYLKGNTEKDRFDMRAGEKFVVTATTQADALEKWLQVIGTSGKDELATYYENLLAQMQKMHADTKAVRDEMVGNSVGSGKWVKEGSALKSALMTQGPYIWEAGTSDQWTRGDYGLTQAGKFGLRWVRTQGVYRSKDHPDGYSDIQIGYPYQNGLSITFRVNHLNAGWGEWHNTYSTANTTVDSNGNIKVASPIVKLFNDHIESNDSFKEKPTFQKLGTGVYKITNTLGLSQNGWTHNIPLNSNGRGYFRVRVEHLEDGCIVRVFKIKNVLNPDTFEIDVIDGDPVDIGKDQRWIDLRFHEEPQEADDEELLTQLDNLDESAH